MNELLANSLEIGPLRLSTQLPPNLLPFLIQFSHYKTSTHQMSSFGKRLLQTLSHLMVLVHSGVVRSRPASWVGLLHLHPQLYQLLHVESAVESSRLHEGSHPVGVGLVPISPVDFTQLEELPPVERDGLMDYRVPTRFLYGLIAVSISVLKLFEQVIGLPLPHHSPYGIVGVGKPNLLLVDILLVVLRVTHFLVIFSDYLNHINQGMYELLTILIVVVKKGLSAFADRGQKDIEDVKDIPYQPPRNQEIDGLRDRKREIESTMQEFNNPSTFAKYSKMQRQLFKIERQVEQLVKKYEQELAISKRQYEQQLEISKKIREEEKKAQVKKLLIIRTIVNLVITTMLSGYYSQSIELGQSWPLSWFCSEGRISCGLIFIAATYLIG